MHKASLLIPALLLAACRTAEVEPASMGAATMLESPRPYVETASCMTRQVAILLRDRRVVAGARKDEKTVDITARKERGELFMYAEVKEKTESSSTVKVYRGLTFALDDRYGQALVNFARVCQVVAPAA